MIVKAPSSLGSATACDCTHCGLPVPLGLVEQDRTEQFCCHGCEGAYQLIHSNGLESFYRMAVPDTGSLSFRDRPAKATQFSEFDSDSFLQKFSLSKNPSQPDEFRITLAVEGMHCAACIWLIEKLPSIVNGVREARVNWTRGTVTIGWNSKLVSLSRIAQTLHRLGYTPYPVRESERANRFKLENRKYLARIGVAAALAGNNMIISAALYLGMFSHMAAGMSQLLRVASCVVGLIALLVPGRIFLSSAFNAVRARSPHMDLPIALALLIGTVVGTINVIRGVGEIYFDSLAVLIFLLLIGRWLQFRQQASAADAVEMLYRLTPSIARKLVDGKTIETMVDLVEPDDLLEIHPGDVLPADGEIVDGGTRVDEAILTGESVPVSKTVGDEVSAGTTNQDSVVVMRVAKIGNGTRLSKIVDSVEEASLSKPQIVQWADKIGGYFVAVVMLSAIATFVWWVNIDVEVAVERAIALLIVACPCALALATPLALAVAMGRSAKNKIMIKSGDVLQSLQKPGTIWLDKTGTLTMGELTVQTWHGDTRHLSRIAALEERSGHPVAKAIVRFADTVHDSVAESASKNNVLERRLAFSLSRLVEEAVEIRGRGMVGVVGGTDVLIGNQALLADHSVFPAAAQTKIAQNMIESGFSPCWVAIDGEVVGLAAIADSIRPEAFDAIRQLKKRGWEPGILSGDHPHIVARVAKRLNIPLDRILGGVDPEGKLKVVKESASKETVVMVGDGVNDSAALAAATVGIAVKNGAEASLAAAPIYFANPGLNPVLELLDISDSTARTMRTNLAVSLGYNLTFAGLAFLGFINPLVAAILMPISSLTVVSLSFRAGRLRRTVSGGRKP